MTESALGTVRSLNRAGCRNLGLGAGGVGGHILHRPLGWLNKIEPTGMEAWQA